MTPFDPRLPIIAAEARVKTTHCFHTWHAMREMGAQFHLAAFAQFAGLEERHVKAIIAALEAHDALPAKRATVAVKAHRLPHDWTLPPDWSEWASYQRHWEPADVQAEADSFADFWQSKPGQAGTKLDWRKTWQNWCRNSRRPDGLYNPNTAAMDAGAQREARLRTAALYDRMGRTDEAAAIRRELDSNVVSIRAGASPGN